MVIVSTPSSPFHYVRFLGPDGQNNVRHGGKAPDLAQNLKAGDIGEPEVKNERYREIHSRPFPRLFAESGRDHLGFSQRI